MAKRTNNCIIGNLFVNYTTSSKLLSIAKLRLLESAFPYHPTHQAFMLLFPYHGEGQEIKWRVNYKFPFWVSCHREHLLKSAGWINSQICPAHTRTKRPYRDNVTRKFRRGNFASLLSRPVAEAKVPDAITVYLLSLSQSSVPWSKFTKLPYWKMTERANVLPRNRRRKLLREFSTDKNMAPSRNCREQRFSF